MCPGLFIMYNFLNEKRYKGGQDATRSRGKDQENKPRKKEFQKKTIKKFGESHLKIFHY